MSLTLLLAVMVLLSSAAVINDNEYSNIFSASHITNRTVQNSF